MEDVEEKLLVADAMKDRAVDAARKAEEKRFKMILSGKLDEQADANRSAAQELLDAQEKAQRAADAARRAQREDTKRQEERIEKAVKAVREAEMERYKEIMKEQSKSAQEDRREAVEKAVKEARRDAEAKEADLLMATEDRIAKVLEEQAQLRALAVKEGRAEEKTIQAQRMRDLVEEHDRVVREMEIKSANELKQLEYQSAQKLLLATREAEREEERTERAFEKIQRELKESEEFAMTCQEKCAVMWNARKIERKTHQFFTNLKTRVEQKRRLERNGARLRQEGEDVIKQ